MRKILFTAVLLTTCTFLPAQTSVDQLLGEVEKNNTRLQSLQKQLDAEGLGNRTGIYPSDPHAEYAFLWGNPSLTGNRVNIALTQSFDFPTGYLYRSRISGARDGQLTLEYSRHLKEVLYEAMLIILELIHRNALEMEYERRLGHARGLRDSYSAMLQQGEASRPALNRVELNLLNLEKEAEINQIERSRLLADLASLNGGIPLPFSGSEYPQETIPPSFDEWYGEAERLNPVLQLLAGETEISLMQEKLNRALSLPSFHAGYMSETVGAEQFRGITAGITIPLWENRNRVSHARAQTEALQSLEADNRIMFRSRLQAAHSRAVSLQESVSGYRRLLQGLDNTGLLRRALDLGEISLSEYILELTIYYNSTDRLMEAELEMHRSLAELYRYH